MATSSKTYFLAQGTPVTAAATVTFLESGLPQTPQALRTLTHPNEDLPPVVYAHNPDRTFNLGPSGVLPSPISRVQLTLDSTKVIRFDRNLRDVIVSEVWEADENQFSMLREFFDRLYELHLNEPTFNPLAQEYIQWAPLNVAEAVVYDVQIVDLFASDEAGDGVNVYDIKEFTDGGGRDDPIGAGTHFNALDSLSELGSGAIDRTVRLVMRIVQEAA